MGTSLRHEKPTLLSIQAFHVSLVHLYRGKFSLNAPPFDPHQLPEVISKARYILPPDITIQIPPNLVKDNQWLLACLEAGARDLGGIGPKDEVNPDYPHPNEQVLREILQPAGWELVPRLPVYPQYESWLSMDLQKVVSALKQ